MSMERDEYLEFNGRDRWRITRTTAVERRNLFAFGAAGGTHVATLTCGSKSGLPRFDRSLRLIESVPVMVDAIERASNALEAMSFLENAEIQLARATLSSLLASLRAPKRD